MDIEVDDCGYDDGEMTRSSNKTISIENHGVVYVLEGVIYMITYWSLCWSLLLPPTEPHIYITCFGFVIVGVFLLLCFLPREVPSEIGRAHV